MTQRAFRSSADTSLDSSDFNHNYRYLKRLLLQLKAENRESVQRELFGENERSRNLSKKEMKALFKFLRRIETQYEECCISPIPEQLEKSILGRKRSDWLPWELEAIEKATSWRKELRARKKSARDMLCEALEKIRNGDKFE